MDDDYGIEDDGGAPPAAHTARSVFCFAWCDCGRAGACVRAVVGARVCGFLPGWAPGPRFSAGASGMLRHPAEPDFGLRA